MLIYSMRKILYVPMRCFFLFLCFQLLFFSVAVKCEEIVKLDSKTALHVSSYGSGILRLVLKPLSGTFYEVEHVVVRDADGDGLQSTCEGLNCVIRSSLCEMETGVTEEIFSATYKCEGSLLVTVRVPLNSIENPSPTFTFPSARRLYGIPEHATDLSLHDNTTYHMYNTDAFQYAINSPQALYGAIPFILAHSANVSTGVLFLNSARMSVTVSVGDIIGCKWDAEVGLVDLFFFPGPTPSMVEKQHAFITGSTLLPPYFSLGYHQCRWNYRSTEDCLSVDEGFDKHNLPYDVLWLDIEHTQGKRYFTWDKNYFSDPNLLISSLAMKGRKLVTIKDPHIKRDNNYFVHDEAERGGYYVKDSEGNSDYVGNCWPGKSSWVDFYNKKARDWYASLFHHDRYEGGSHDVHTWVDMNEPSVFDVEEKTIHSDVKHTSDRGELVENKYLHNMYSFYSTMAAYQGHIESSKDLDHVKRPFILTRSFFSGSQRHTGMWTGDNAAQWEHLQNSFPELLSISLSNYPFCGADIGGFFFDTKEELFVRWMQAGVFYPFMRAHSHLETKRREPWMFGEAATNRVRAALALRYSLLPYLYTQFFVSNMTGSIVLRPLFYEFPHDETLYDEQYTFMFGPSLLASPVIEEGVTEKNVTLPAGNVWYSYPSGKVVPTGIYRMSVDMDSIPLFFRGGHIVPAKLRMRRNVETAKNDPFTLYVALNEYGNSEGSLFLDDGESFNYLLGAYAYRRFSFTANKLTCTKHFGEENWPSQLPSTFRMNNVLERVIIYGYTGKPKRVVVETDIEPLRTGKEIEFYFEQGVLTLRKPDVPIGSDWSIIIE